LLKWMASCGKTNSFSIRRYARPFTFP
jgi:hypothetical protein